VAQAGGDIPDLGPQVIAATRVEPGLLLVDVRHDASHAFAPLNNEAASGLGWSIATQDGHRIEANGAALLDADSLALRFAEPVPDGAVLDYAWGIGRTAHEGEPGRGNAVMDENHLPVWTPAAGVAVTPAHQDGVWG
jgi:hypothetical protein